MAAILLTRSTITDHTAFISCLEVYLIVLPSFFGSSFIPVVFIGFNLGRRYMYMAPDLWGKNNNQIVSLFVDCQNNK